jgi:hypothetical protein
VRLIAAFVEAQVDRVGFDIAWMAWCTATSGNSSASIPLVPDLAAAA